jgi:hypothetical protein
MGFELRDFYACKADALPLAMPPLWSIFVFLVFEEFCCSYFGDGNVTNFFSGLALNYNPPDLSLPSS